MNFQLALFLVVSQFFFIGSISSQCNPHFESPLSSRTSSYKIDCKLFDSEKKVKASQIITFQNPSEDSIHHLKFYMYMNAFKNTESTWIKGAGSNVFGMELSSRKAEEFGWIDMLSIKYEGEELIKNSRYVQDLDGNRADQTVLEVTLNTAILPKAKVEYHIEFETKLPKTVARAGYEKNDYFMFNHWFPQLGVFEKNESGDCDWNCHQYHRRTEYYADFGNYDVSLDIPDHFVIGASGCKMKEEQLQNNRKRIRYYVEDVIDFAWVAYPHFLEYNEQWENVNIRLLISEAHSEQSFRIFKAAKEALSYLDEHVGEYPFSSLTIVNPPIHALRTGFMEYPTFVTIASFYYMPSWIRSMESLVIHEITHQYFMMMLASNEKEEAWMDEGFVTYYEDRILDHYYGSDGGFYNFLGYKTGNKSKSRNEYLSIENPMVGSIARPGWEIKENYKGLVYSKMSTLLQTLENILGKKNMDNMMRSYFDEWKFDHPKGKDFMKWVCYFSETVNIKNFDCEIFFQQFLYGDAICDYTVSNINPVQQLNNFGVYDENGSKKLKNDKTIFCYENIVRVERIADAIVPVELLVSFEDGTSKMLFWDGASSSKEFSFQCDKKIVSATLDPSFKIQLDKNMNNNSITVSKNDHVARRYKLKTGFWYQNILQLLTALL